MDAEIGVRDLADSSRYNVLPDIINAFGLARDMLHGETEAFEDLPEYEKLSMLVRYFECKRAATVTDSVLPSPEPRRS